MNIEARCAVAGYAHSALTFAPSEVTRYGWVCSCSDCERQAVGTGRTQHEALEEYARAHRTPLDHIEVTGERHV